MPHSSPQKNFIDEDIYVIEQTPDMELKDFIKKVKMKVQQVLSETANNSKHTNN